MKSYRRRRGIAAEAKTLFAALAAVAALAFFAIGVPLYHLHECVRVHGWFYCFT